MVNKIQPSWLTLKQHRGDAAGIEVGGYMDRFGMLNDDKNVILQLM